MTSKYLDTPNKNEQKILNKLNNTSNEIIPDENLKSINTIIKKTTSVILEIINDIVNIEKIELVKIHILRSTFIILKN